MEKSIVIKSEKGDINLPCMSVKIVHLDKVQANNYNPNHVSRPNMLLLEKSILANGFCFPVVTIYDEQNDKYIIVDGFHRYLIFRDYLKAAEIPIVILNQNISQRMAATIQFNRARGVHQIEETANLIAELINQGLAEDEIAKSLGMELEEVLRLKQVTGIAEIFKNESYSSAWEILEK